MCCHASKVFISPDEALTATLGRETKSWRELVIYICSLVPEGPKKIVVQENHQNALKFLKTTFHVSDGMFVSRGLYNTQIKFKDVLELIRTVLDGVSAVFKISGYEVNPFFELEDPERL